MAEEPRKNKTGLEGTPKRLTKSIRGVALGMSLVCFLSAISPGAQGLANNQVEIQVAYQSDLSLPLWGGVVAVISSSSSLQDVLPTDEIKLHHFDQIPCGNCHEAPAASGDSVFEDNSDWKTTVDVNRSCTSFGCHDYDEKMNHPVDAPLPASVSGSVSSGQSSSVTCLSCHQPQQMDGNDTSDGQTDRFLQNPELVGCESCHDRLSGSIRQQSHWKFSQKAHLVPLTPASFDDKTSDDFMNAAIDGIDIESSTCLSCHDEVTVTIPAMNETPQQKADRFRSMTDHPIGMNYQYILAQNPMYFNSLMGKQDRIRMFDGKVGCGSCHSLYSVTPSNLVAEYNGSVLCRTCHNR